MNESVFLEIESPRFMAYLSVLSSFDLFHRALAQRAPCQVLLAASVAPGVRLAVLRRLIEVANRPIDARYENPWDTSLAAYLWVLSQSDTEFAILGATLVAKTPNCSWSVTLAEMILQATRVQSEPGEVVALTHNPYVHATATGTSWQTALMFAKDSLNALPDADPEVPERAFLQARTPTFISDSATAPGLAMTGEIRAWWNAAGSMTRADAFSARTDAPAPVRMKTLEVA